MEMWLILMQIFKFVFYEFNFCPIELLLLLILNSIFGIRMLWFYNFFIACESDEGDSSEYCIEKPVLALDQIANHSDFEKTKEQKM